MNFLSEIVASSAVMMLAWLGSTLLRSYLTRRKGKFDLRLRKNGEELDLPVATDWESLKKRLDVLAQISPRLAILDGWQLIEWSILNRASAVKGIDAIRASDVIAIAQSLPGIRDSTIARLKHIRKFRNLVAHSADLSKQGDELRAVVEELVPVMEELDPRFQSMPLTA